LEDDAPGNYDGILESGGLKFAERFEGQNLSTTDSFFDVLSESATSPLTLQTGVAGENVEVMFYDGNNTVHGLGPEGYSSPLARGEGSLAVLFPSPQSQFKFDIVGAGGEDSATLNFFGVDGSSLGTIVITPTSQTYGFRHVGGIREIAGFSIHNTDDGGMGYDNICYADPIVMYEVDIDIKPTSCPNPLNVKSKGVLPIAILGADDFDVTAVDPDTVLLEGVAPLRWALEDVATPWDGISGDGYCEDCWTEGPDRSLDLTLKFDKQEVVAALGTVEHEDCLLLTLTGNLKEEFGGTAISGEDVVRIIKKGK
jgi:hypothetical protein